MPRRPKTAPSPAARRRKPAPRRGRARLLVTAAAILAAIAVTVTLVTRREKPPSPPAVEAELPPQRMSYPALVALANQVKSLQIEKRYAESLPGSRALLKQHELGRRLTPPMLVDYARILNNVAFEPGRRAPRSSFERISLEREALQSCTRALAIANAAPESSEAMTLVGLIHEAWGFPDDAYLTYVAATETDPKDPEARMRLDAFVRRMNPTGPAHPR